MTGPYRKPAQLHSPSELRWARCDSCRWEGRGSKLVMREYARVRGSQHPREPAHVLEHPLCPRCGSEHIVDGL